MPVKGARMLKKCGESYFCPPYRVHPLNENFFELLKKENFYGHEFYYKVYFFCEDDGRRHRTGTNATE